MKIVFGSHSELCHQFAANPHGEGRSNNMSFSDGALYSYGTAIMRVMEHKGQQFLLVNNSGYSNSTCKHMGHARSATRHYAPVFRIDGLGRGVSLDYTMRELGPKLYACAIDNAAQSKQKSIKARTNKAYLLERSVEQLAEAQRVSDFFGLRKKVDEKAIEKLIKEKDAAARKHAKEIKEQQLRREERDRLDREQAERDLALWVRNEPLEGYGIHHFRGLPVRLRVEAESPDNPLHGDGCREIVTSLGARIPYVSGKRTFLFYMKHHHDGWVKNGEQFQIGAYQLDRISPAGLKAGCHFIQADEIERFAKQEGWLQGKAECEMCKTNDRVEGHKLCPICMEQVRIQRGLPTSVN